MSPGRGFRIDGGGGFEGIFGLGLVVILTVGIEEGLGVFVEWEGCGVCEGAFGCEGYWGLGFLLGWLGGGGGGGRDARGLGAVGEFGAGPSLTTPTRGGGVSRQWRWSGWRRGIPEA